MFGLELRQNDKGRAVYATGDIPRGQIIATGPVVEMDMSGTPLENHTWGRNKLTFAITSFCNHSDDPNCVSVVYGDTDLLVSIQAIGRDEEITLNYFDFE